MGLGKFKSEDKAVEEILEDINPDRLKDLDSAGLIMLNATENGIPHHCPITNGLSQCEEKFPYLTHIFLRGPCKSEHLGSLHKQLFPIIASSQASKDQTIQDAVIPW